MTVVKTNRKLVQNLRLSLDVVATQAALDRGEITSGQAKGILKWMATAKDILANPVYDVLNDAKQFVGDVTTQGGGTSWIARRYGKSYHDDGVEFTSLDEALAFAQVPRGD